MRVDEFDFTLPPELIAQYPLPERSASRLLCLEQKTGQTQHRQFAQVLDLIQPEDLLVFNDTKVIPARLYAYKATGAQVELLIERCLSETTLLAHVKRAKKLKAGQILFVAEGVGLQAVERKDECWQFVTVGATIAHILTEFGHMPLPMYIKREDEITDQTRYQTVYAKNPGAVGAPTAGLHFDETVLAQLKQKGVTMVFVTLHVGAGTFQSIRVEHLEEHVMHYETIAVDKHVCEAVIAAKQRGGRVIAVGTTSVRSLETAAKSGEIQPYSGETNLFIYPGYRFNVVDAIITNFHLPQSTLLMLICAFAGREQVLAAYQAAIEQQYRFFSYGDAMFIS